MATNFKIDDGGGSAFPLFDGSAHYGGMTLRDYFAGQALAGMSIPNSGEFSEQDSRDGTMQRKMAWRAQAAYAIADAMLKERLP